MMIEAVLWDNDGVLVDSEAVFFEITRLAFARLRIDLTIDTWATQYLGQGKGTCDIAISLGADPATLGPMIDDRNEQYRTALKQPPELRPKVLETLTALSDTVKMAIVTGCRREQLQLMHDHSQILDFFDVIITADDYDEPKPSPAPYLTAMKAMDLNPGNCIAVEDSKRGVISATAAGIACVAVPTSLTRMQNFPDAIAVEKDVSGVVKHIV